MRALLKRRPFLAAALLASAVVVGGAVIVLPRLDGVEIRAVEPDGDRVRVRVGYRLRSAAHGRLELIALAPDGEVRSGRSIGAGDGEVDMVVTLPDAAERILVVELRPHPRSSGLIEAFSRSRRRDLRPLRGLRSRSAER